MSEVTEETKLTISDFKSQISCMINAITQLNSTDRTEAFGYLLKCVNNLDTEKEIKNDNEEVKENREIDQEKCESNLEYSGHETLNDCIEDQGENDQQHQEVNSTLNEYIDTNSSKYKCAVCDETFLKLKQLYFHGVKQHPGSSVTCKNCNKSFSNEQINDIHTYLKICKSHEPLVCSFCNKEYRNFQHFSLHLEGHKQNNCKECGLNLSNRKSLEEHMIKEHNKKLDRQLFMCKFCDRKFAQKRSLLKHYKLQHSKDNIICLACGAVFKSTEELKEHEQTHVEKSVSFTCVICKENFSRRQQYVIHMKDHDKYQCETCELSYPNKTKLEWHEQKGHVIKGLPMQHQCSICSNEFHFQSSLFFHKKLHSNSEKDKFECKPCKQIFKTYEICRQHLLTERHAKFTNQTESDEILMCKYCKKVFTNKRLLLKHENKHNKGNVIYQCEICDFKTRSNPCLNKHEKLHTKKKELICDKCGDSFYTKSALLDHFSYVHSDERNFSCEKCGRTFKTASVLNRHMLSHSNESTFRCISCGKSFKFRGNLTRHLTLVHSEMTASKRVKRLISDDVANLTSNSNKKKKKQELKQQQQQHVNDNTATLYAVIDAQSVSIPIDQVIMQSSVLLSNSHQDNQMLHLSLNNMNFSNESKSQLIYTQPLDITNLQEVDNILQSEESLKNTTEMVNSVHDNMFEQQLTDADANNAFLNTESLIHPPIEPSLVTSLGDSLNSGTHQLDDPHHHQLAGTSQSNLLPISEYNTLPVPYNIQFLNM